MEKRKLRLLFSSGISELTEHNSSFDKGILRVAYTGKNPNNSSISREAFERSLPSIYNCPIVCNYDREENEIGGHDVEIVSDEDGGMRLVNLTQPVGVVPESAKHYWEEIEDNSGVHEYLCVEVLLWKRQEAYRKIKEDGVTDESMEIEVKEGSMADGVYVIDLFEFQAFCLLGRVRPCFESAGLEVFSAGDFKEQLAQMMREFKDTLSSPAHREYGLEEQHDSEGGSETLDEKRKLLAQFGLQESELDFKLEDYSLEELREKLEAKPADTGSGAGAEEKFALENQFRDELWAAVENGSEKVETCWGLERRYYVWDYDHEASQVYVEDVTDWNIYALPFTMEGDRVEVDFTQKTRMKLAVVPFEDGAGADPMAGLISTFSTRYAENDKRWTEKYQELNEKFSAMEEEVAQLRKFEEDTKGETLRAQRQEILDRFEDLSGVEAFEALREGSANYSVEDLEEKCFAIRGRAIASGAKFSLQEKTPKLKVDKTGVKGNEEPYGGVFAEYGYTR